MTATDHGVDVHELTDEQQAQLRYDLLSAMSLRRKLYPIWWRTYNHNREITEVATHDTPGLMDSEDKAKLDGLRHVDSSLTVNIPGEYPTIQEAIDDLSGGIVSRGETVNLHIEAGHQPATGIDVRDGDYSMFRVTSQDDLVTVADGFEGHFIAGQRAHMPQLHALIDMNDQGEDGISASTSSTCVVASGAGVRNAGGRGCYMNQGSKVTAARAEFTGANNRNVWVSRSSTFEGSLGNFSANKGGQRAVYVSRGSFANVFSADISNAKGDGALYVLRSFVCAQDVNVSNAEGDGICVTTGAVVAARLANADDCGRVGLRAMDGGTISADRAMASGCGSDGFRASDGSSIAARSSTASNCGRDGYRAEDGSSISARSAVAEGNGGAGFQALYGSRVNARDTAASSNGVGEYVIIGGAEIVAAGTSITAADTNVTSLDALVPTSGIIYT